MEFFPILIILMIVISVGASVATQARKNKAKQSGRSSEISDSKPEMTTGYNTQRREADPFFDNSGKTNRALNENKKIAVEKRNDQGNAAKERANGFGASIAGENTAVGTLKDYKPITSNIKTHAHIGREEKNIPTEESMGKISDLQGCGEHYYSRFVSDTSSKATQRDDEAVKNSLKTAIVLGEVINKPAFKRKDGKIR